jgi:hypothetical protein
VARQQPADSCDPQKGHCITQSSVCTTLDIPNPPLPSSLCSQPSFFFSIRELDARAGTSCHQRPSTTRLYSHHPPPRGLATSQPRNLGDRALLPRRMSPSLPEPRTDWVTWPPGETPPGRGLLLSPRLLTPCGRVLECSRRGPRSLPRTPYSVQSLRRSV